jgi:hypothetical protein
MIAIDSKVVLATTAPQLAPERRQATEWRRDEISFSYGDLVDEKLTALIEAATSVGDNGLARTLRAVERSNGGEHDVVIPRASVGVPILLRFLAANAHGGWVCRHDGSGHPHPLPGPTPRSGSCPTPSD